MQMALRLRGLPSRGAQKSIQLLPLRLFHHVQGTPVVKVEVVVVVVVKLVAVELLFSHGIRG